MRLTTIALFVSLAVTVHAQASTVTILAGGSQALTLSLPEADGAKTISKGDQTIIQVPGKIICHLWTVAGVKTPEEAIARVPELIKGEFVGFQATQTNTLTIADAASLHLIGTGTEEDDGDAGHADVILFTVGPHVFAACIHGEMEDAEERAALLALVQTAQLPANE